MSAAQRSNPWGLTAGEAKAIQAVIDTGSNKGAARSTGLSLKTVEAYFCRSKVKIGGATRLACLLTWDRWARGGGAADDAKQLRHCAIAVRDWLQGGCDVHDIPRQHIDALIRVGLANVARGGGA